MEKQPTKADNLKQLQNVLIGKWKLYNNFTKEYVSVTKYNISDIAGMLTEFKDTTHLEYQILD